MTKNKTPKADEPATRSALRALAKRHIADLRTAYQHAFDKEPGDLSRDALIKSLAATVETEQPAPSHPEQAEPKNPVEPTTRKTGARDPRVPEPGTILERTYKGKTHRVTVLRDGFGYERETYRSLTAVARKVTGYAAISGTLFFGIAKRASRTQDAATQVTPPAPATEDAPVRARARGAGLKARRAPKSKPAKKGSRR